MTTKRTQLSVIAVAALAIFAVAAVMLLAGGVPAQATTASLAPDSGGGAQLRPQAQDPTLTPTPPTPLSRVREACSATPDAVVDSGHIALFDVWWNPEEKELTNNSCPPTVTHVPATYDDLGDLITPARDDRSPSSINIDETIIHIPNSAKVDLSTSTTYTEAKYLDVWRADDEENPNGDGDRIVWVLPACPPIGSPPAGGLCISYSAALLNPAQWNDNIEYLVGHVHQVDIDKQDQRYVLVYDLPNGEAGQAALRWDSSNAEFDEVDVAPGGYDRPMWFFTSRGAYEFQVHIRGKPNTNADAPLSKDPSVTSDVREYILHVGAEADLSATLELTPPSPSPTNEVTIEITARNAGPDAAPSAKVDVTLPDGLTSPSIRPSTGTYADGVWDIGELAVTNGNNAPTLTIKATVGAGTLGHALTAKATISATETLTTTSGTHHVPVPDSDPDNNTAMRTVTVTSNANVNPMFRFERSVAENSPANTWAGGTIWIQEPDSDDLLTAGVTGDGAENFDLSSTPGGMQLVVSNNADLDYECRTNYSLTLQVSDGKDQDGNPDTAIDDTIPLVVNITNVPDKPTVDLDSNIANPTPGQEVTLTATPSVDTAPCGGAWQYTLWDDESGSLLPIIGPQNSRVFKFTGLGGPRRFRVDMTYDPPEGATEITAHSTLSLDW